MLRSLLIGDCDYYLSPYIFGVNQGMTRLGHIHSQVSIRQSIEVIEQRVRDVKPDILWTHMLLWPPYGAPPVEQLVALCERAARRGCRVIIHDGDYKKRCRHAHDLSTWCAVALCNHHFDRTAWRVPILHWPYWAFQQDVILPPSPEWACELWFAGRMDLGEVYGERTALLQRIRHSGVHLRMPTDAEGNTLLRTPEIAASAQAVLGFGRRGDSGWIDTRVTQYPGAGGILLHDEVCGLLEPWEHYVPYRSGEAESIVEALGRLRAMSESERWALRERAFRYVQEHHSSVARVRQVLRHLGLAAREAA